MDIGSANKSLFYLIHIKPCFTYICAVLTKKIEIKTVVFYELGNVSMEKVMEVYPRHKSIVDEFTKENKIIGIGTFANPAEGSMGIFRDKEYAEQFIKKDPFVLEGIVGKITTKEWNDIIL